MLEREREKKSDLNNYCAGPTGKWKNKNSLPETNSVDKTNNLRRSVGQVENENNLPEAISVGLGPAGRR